jgi:hypothetical protein
VSNLRIELEQTTSFKGVDVTSPYDHLSVNVSAEYGILTKNVDPTALLLTFCHLERQARNVSTGVEG